MGNTPHTGGDQSPNKIIDGDAGGETCFE